MRQADLLIHGAAIVSFDDAGTETVATGRAGNSVCVNWTRGVANVTVVGNAFVVPLPSSTTYPPCSDSGKIVLLPAAMGPAATW